MYDIKIFLEENNQLWARLNAGKEVIYGLWNTQDELMMSLKQGLETSFWDKQVSKPVNRLFEYVDNTKHSEICL